MDTILARLVLCCLVAGVLAVIPSESLFPLLATIAVLVASAFGLWYALALVVGWLTRK